jgi:hypothetical protein
VGPITTSGAGRVSIDAGATNDITLNHASNFIAGELRVDQRQQRDAERHRAYVRVRQRRHLGYLGEPRAHCGGPVSQTRAVPVDGTTSISAERTRSR